MIKPEDYRTSIGGDMRHNSSPPLSADISEAAFLFSSFVFARLFFRGLRVRIKRGVSWTLRVSIDYYHGFPRQYPPYFSDIFSR